MLGGFQKGNHRPFGHCLGLFQGRADGLVALSESRRQAQGQEIWRHTISQACPRRDNEPWNVTGPRLSTIGSAVTSTSITASFCRHFDISTGFTASRNFVEYGIDGGLLRCQNGSVFQLQRDIQVVTLEDMRHLTRVKN